MVMRFLVTALCVLTARGAAASDDVPVLQATDIREGKLVKTDYYAGEALYGYIDGGADLYLEYGFRKLARQEVQSDSERIVVEVYQMRTAVEAFGIFSILRFRCSPIDSLTPHSCLSPYQLQAVLGDCYLSIINESGSRAAQRISVDLFRAIEQKITPQTINLPAIFHRDAFESYLRNLISARGKLGVLNGIPEWEPFFRNLRDFSLTVLPVESGEEQVRLAHIRFRSPEDLSDFWRTAGFDPSRVDSTQEIRSGRMRRIVRKLGANETVYLESSLPPPDLKPFLDALREGR